MSGPQPVTFGTLLRAHRTRAGLSQQRLADLAGMSVRTLRYLESGRTGQPQRATVGRLAAALGLPENGLDDRGLRIEILGPLNVRDATGQLEIGAGKQRCLLALLALQHGAVVGRDQIVDVLWGVRPPPSHVNLVQTYVTRLRRLLGRDVIESVRGGYRMFADADRLDLVRFDDLAGRGNGQDGRAGLDLLAEALACWRGPIAADLPVTIARHPAAVAAGRRRLTAVLALAGLAIELGQPERALGPLGSMAEDEPLHEGLAARLMLALAASGQQAAALRLHAEVRGRLADELGVDQGPQLRAAHLQIVRGQVPAVPVVRQGGPAQLPADIPSFTGRGAQLAALDDLLDGARGPVLAAITGSAGVGKSTLAVRWAHRVRDWFPDGQLHANLRGHAQGVPLRPVEVLGRFLTALGVPRDRVPIEQDEAAALFRTVLAGKRVMVVLDDAADATQVRPLLPGAPGCLVVVTSRDRLSGLVAHQGATRLAVDVLPADESYALVAKVIGRARADAERAATQRLVEACARLPLALRIAAADLVDNELRTVAEQDRRLRAGTLTALSLDGDGSTAVRTAFDLSYAAQQEPTRVLFRLLGLAPVRDFSVASAAALADVDTGTAAALLDRLAAAHLVQQHGADRYAFHDLLRVYAEERALAEDDPTIRTTALHRLYRHQLSTVDQAARVAYPNFLRLPMPDPDPRQGFDSADEALGWLDTEFTNLCDTIEHTTRSGPLWTAKRLADGLRGYMWHRLMTVECRAVFEHGISASLGDGDQRAELINRVGLASWHFQRYRCDDAIAEAERALAVGTAAGWPEGEAAALNLLGNTHNFLGNTRTALAKYTASVDRYQRGTIRRAAALGNIGRTYRELGEGLKAIEYCTRATELAAREGHQLNDGVSLRTVGVACRDLGRLPEAIDHLDRAYTQHKAAGDRYNEALTLADLAGAYVDSGRADQALELAGHAVDLAREVGDQGTEAQALEALGGASLGTGRITDAIAQYERSVDLARAVGLRFTLVESLIGLATALGRTAEARAYVDEALTIARQSEFGLLAERAAKVRSTLT